MTIVTQNVDVYAKALLESQVSEESLEKGCVLLQQNPILWETLCNPAITKIEKQNVIQKIFPEDIVMFLQVLNQNGRMTLFFDIVKTYQNLLQEQQGIGKATVYYTILPDDTQKRAIADMLCKLEHKNQFILDWKEDKSLLGGICVQCGNKQYDRSVKNSLKLLKKKLTQGVKP